MFRSITGRLASWVVASMLCAGAAFGQMSPEEAQRQLEEKQRQQQQIEAEAQAQTGGRPVPGTTDTPTTQWPLVALRSGGYLCQLGEQVFCNANYDSHFAKTCRRMIGKAAQPVRNSFKIKLGDIETPLNNYRNVKRTPVLHEIVHQRSEDEQFAQTQAIGQPVVDEFGFIHHARVAQVVDDQTLWLDQIHVLPKPDFQADYKKQTELGRFAYYGTWHDPRYDLQAVVRNTKVPYGSYFRESMPTSGELYIQRCKMIDWEYESQQALLPIQQMWNSHRLKLVGVPTATLHAGQRWEGADTQIAIVSMEGQNPVAVPSLLLAKPMTRDVMIAFMQKRGFTPESMTDVVRKITANRVVGQSPERRIALMLAGRPLPEDAAFLPGNPTAAAANGIPAPAVLSTPGTAPETAPGTAGTPAPAIPAIDKSLLFDMPAALQNMLKDTIGDQNRQIDDLLASVFDDWWQSHQKGQTIEISGAFLGADRVEPRTYLTRRLIIREDCSKARFAVGTMTLQPDQRTYGIDDIPVGPYRFKVIVYALFTGENKMTPLKLQIPDTSRPMPETIVRGSVVETRFTPNGIFELYLNDCQLPQ
ncbi:MAG: hypothetical protein ACYC26_11250 [Phycisphaerales bacterium]